MNLVRRATAQVMIIAGCDNGSSISLPNWRLNLRFAGSNAAKISSLLFPPH